MKKERKIRSPKFRQAMSSIYAILDYVFRIVMLNLLIVVPALLPFLIYTHIEDKMSTVNDLFTYLTLLPAVIYMFPAIVAATSCFKAYEENTTKGVFKEFFVAFGKNYFKSLLISIFLFLTLFILFFEIRFNGYEFYGIFFYFIRNITNYACLIGLFITISFIIMGLFILSHLPLVLVYFDDISIWQQFKLAFIMAFRKIGKTILICLIIIAFTFLCLLQGLEIIIFIFGISLPLFLIVKITFKEYIKIYRKVENKENEKNDKIV